MLKVIHILHRKPLTIELLWGVLFLRIKYFPKVHELWVLNISDWPSTQSIIFQPFQHLQLIKTKTLGHFEMQIITHSALIASIEVN